MLFTWFILRHVNQIYRVLGRIGSVVIARVMSLLLAAIAVQFILIGIAHYLATVQ